MQKETRSTSGEENLRQLWQTGRVLKSAFAEHADCARDVYTRSARYLYTPEDSPEEFRTQPGRIPESFFSVRRNLFSTLFMSVYFLLDIPAPRRAFYGRLNQLFRIWVTSADNLLDDEDKQVLPVAMPGQSHVMQQVVAVMAADRVLHELLNESVGDGVMTRRQADTVCELSLRILLPSAAQEGAEETGVHERPAPDYVLWTIHRVKTGLLFHIPFLGPDHIEDAINPALLRRLKTALMDIGLGCQLLDDVRDLARDFVERRHNYVLSCLAWNKSPLLNEWAANSPAVEDRLYLRCHADVIPVVRQGLDMMRSGLGALATCGLGVPRSAIEPMARCMTRILDLEELAYA